VQKQLKASTEITIGRGSFNIDSADDVIHSNNSVNIAGGDISIAFGDDGIHADTSIIIKGGKINITKSYEGIESALVTVSDGEIHVTSGDDGINIAGGNDESAINGRPGQNNFSSSGNNKLNINGGYIVISSPELKKDTAYTFYSGGTSTGSGADGLYTDGEYQAGTKIVDFTISQSVTWLSETGVTTSRSSNPGAHPNFDENQNRPGKGRP